MFMGGVHGPSHGPWYRPWSVCLSGFRRRQEEVQVEVDSNRIFWREKFRDIWREKIRNDDVVVKDMAGNTMTWWLLAAIFWRENEGLD